MKNAYRFPNDQQRLSIVGATGSGKTYAALYHLAQRDFTKRPWVIYDFKVDENINSIPGAQRIDITDPVPERPGLYIVNPLPGSEDVVEEQMWSIWSRGNTGVYIDEGYMIGNNNRAFRALLTQGRSKYIPMIVLAQRPVWLDRFVFSESEFFQIFRLQHRKDIANVQEFIPFDIRTRLPEHHSYYYDVGRNEIVIMTPVPDVLIILRQFDAKLRRLPKVV